MCIPREKRTMSHTVTRREKKSNTTPRINIKQHSAASEISWRANEQATTAAAVAAKVNVRMRRKKSAEAAAEKRETEREIGNHHYTH